MNHNTPVLVRCRLVLWITLLSLVTAPLAARAQIGDITPVHDPSIIQSGDTFYLFCTGHGIPQRTSTDLFHWKRIGSVFSDIPSWTRDYDRNARSMWAPDISLINGEYRLYYAVSSFGKTASAIGLAVNKTLDVSSADYHWIDRGKVISTPAQNDWNAIDPCAFDDTDGNNWMVLGSCWTGLKLVQLDAKTGLLADAHGKPQALSAYPPDNIIEEGYVRRHGDFYYLWESVDHCCMGIRSTYRILVGRSKQVRGPYLDRDGKPLLRGGGTLVLASYDNVRGPGSCAIIPFGGEDFLIHHEYDANNRGIPTLQIRQLFWADDDWPLAGEPIVRSPLQKASPAMPIAGDWLVRTDFGTPKPMTFNQDGKIGPLVGYWALDGKNLTINQPTPARVLVDRCTLSDDGTFFVGRDATGAVLSGRRAQKDGPKIQNSRQKPP